jgi:hypothetical protein
LIIHQDIVIDIDSKLQEIMMLIFFLSLLVNHLHVATALVDEWVTVEEDVAKAMDEALVHCEDILWPKPFKKCVNKATKPFVKDGTLSKEDVTTIWEGLWSSCPVGLPTGKSCRYSQKGMECDYSHIVVPESDEDGKCTGRTFCSPTSGCDCHGGGEDGSPVWSCWMARRDLKMASCQGDVPEDIFQPCTPDTGCPADMSEVLGAGTCSTYQVDLQCEYEHLLVPEIDNEGKCTGELTCTAISGCDCAEDVLEWRCWSTRRNLAMLRCEGDVPEDAYTMCEP